MALSSTPGTAIVGLGITEQGKVYGRGAVEFAVEAIRLALDDAGLGLEDLDGVLVNPGVSWGMAGSMASFAVQRAMGLRDLSFGASISLGGASAGAMIQQAALAVDAGLATHVACVFSDAPLRPPKLASANGASGSASAYSHSGGLDTAHGLFGVAARYALLAQRHMHRFGTTQDQLGAVAVGERAFAQGNPHAEFHGRPMTLDDYHASRWVAEPFHLLDCCLVSNGGVAVVVSSAERARDLRRPPVHILGMAQGHPGGDPLETLASGAVSAGPAALGRAGITSADVDFCELYDCYTFTVLVTLEDYGFCAKGEGGAFVEGGRIGPGGELPVNTGGGQLSAYYMWGMTPISEAVIQIRGDGGERQVRRNEIGLVSGNGGLLSTHSTLVLGRSAPA